MLKGMTEQIKIIGICGSLRKDSFNHAALRAATELASEGVVVETFDLKDIPPFDQDFEKTPPEIIKQFKAKIKAADAVLFVTPEFNYSISGVLKNAIDWASRPYGDSAWEGKPAAIMSAGMGMLGGVRAQYHLRQMGVFLNIHFMNRPEIMIPFAQEKFSPEGVLIDEMTKTKIKELMKALVIWTKKIKSIE
jgi:chromate reductase